MNDVIYNLVLAHFFSICIMVVCMVTTSMGRACNHSLPVLLFLHKQTIVFSDQYIQLNAFIINLKIKKQQANKGNSVQTVKLLQP